MERQLPGLGRELINLLDGQFTRVRHVSIADVLLRSGETTLWAKIGIARLATQ
jgi:hypothetical protein